MRQSILWWCYQNTHLTPEQLVRVAVEVGYTGIEVFDPAYFPLVRQHGLDLVAIQGHAPLEDGLNQHANADRLVAMMNERIALAEQWHIPNLIVFSGRSHRQNIGTGSKTCGGGWGAIGIGDAEQQSGSSRLHGR